MVQMDSNMETLTTQNRKTNFSIAAIMSGLQAKEVETKVDIAKDDSSDNLPPLDKVIKKKRSTTKGTLLETHHSTASSVSPPEESVPGPFGPVVMLSGEKKTKSSSSRPRFS